MTFKKSPVKWRPASKESPKDWQFSCLGNIDDKLRLINDKLDIVLAHMKYPASTEITEKPKQEPCDIEFAINSCIYKCKAPKNHDPGLGHSKDILIARYR